MDFSEFITYLIVFLLGLLAMVIAINWVFSEELKGENRFFPDFVTAISVIDGDTLKARLKPDSVGFSGDEKNNTISIRVAGVDTPELRDENPTMQTLAILARTVVENAVNQARHIRIEKVGGDKYYNRIVCNVYADGKSIAETLLEYPAININGADMPIAVKYDGKSKKEAWERMGV